MTIEQKQKPTTCTKNRVLIETKVVIERGSHYSDYFSDPERRAKSLEEWAAELREFFRDHRSQDVNSVSVEREYQEQCSACHREWEECEYEPDGDTPGYTGCAWCGLPMEITR